VDFQAQVYGGWLSEPVQGSLGTPGVYPAPRGGLRRDLQHVKPTTVRTVLTLIVSRGWPVHQLDVKNSSLHNILIETVYGSQLVDFVESAHPQLVCWLNKYLYGLKKVSQAWYHYFTSYLVFGFEEAKVRHLVVRLTPQH
jgi:hypothetical protein